MNNVEMYYGYYLGDAHVWDTFYIEMDSDHIDDPCEFEARCQMKCLDEISKSNPELQVAFCGIYAID